MYIILFGQNPPLKKEISFLVSPVYMSHHFQRRCCCGFFVVVVALLSNPCAGDFVFVSFLFGFNISY